MASRDTALEKKCACCLKPTDRRCGACKSRWYCSEQHQIDDWLLGHREECRVCNEVRLVREFPGGAKETVERVVGPKINAQLAALFMTSQQKTS